MSINENSNEQKNDETMATDFLKQKSIVSSSKDIIFSFIFLIVAIITVNFSLFYDFNLGFTISYLLFLTVSFLYLKPKGLKFTPFVFLCLITSVAFSFVFCIYNDDFTLFFVFVRLIILTAMMFLALCNAAKFSNSSYQYIFDVLNLLIVVPLDGLESTVKSLFNFKKNNKYNKNVISIFLGALCALPILIVILPLLISSDAAFEGLIQNLFNFETLFGSIIIGLLLFIPLFTIVFSLKHDNVKLKGKSKSNFKGLNVFALNSFLGIICFVYLIYFLSQTAYFINGFAKILPEGYSFAEYARRGFFEMSIICAINLAVIFITSVLSKKSNGKLPASQQFLALAVCLYSLLFISSVAAKMYLYINKYGMTRLRILTSVFMLLLLIVFILVIIRLFAPKFPYMRVAIISILLVGLTVCYADIDTVISKYNVYAYKANLTQTIDVQSLELLSDSSVPFLIELLDDKDEEVVLQAKYALKSKLSWHFDYDENNELMKIQPDDFRAFNYNQQRAEKLLIANKDRILN